MTRHYWTQIGLIWKYHLKKSSGYYTKDNEQKKETTVDRKLSNFGRWKANGRTEADFSKSQKV